MERESNKKSEAIVVTGRPGSGKTTLVLKIVERAKEIGISTAGVLTPEIRSERRRGKRKGFHVIGISKGEKKLLAVDEKEADQKLIDEAKQNKKAKRCRMGRYTVFPENFTYILKKEMETRCDLFIVDELGPMELECSNKLKQWVYDVLGLTTKKVLTVKKNLVELTERWADEFINLDEEEFSMAYAILLEFATGTDAFLFDLDGVLVDSAEFHMKSWQELMKEKGIEFTEDDFRRTFGMTNDLILRRYFPDTSPEEIRRMGERKEEIYRELAHGRIKPISGANKFLEFLKSRGIHLALVSSTPRENIDFLFKELGIGRFFDVVISGSDIKRGKPDPECYIKAAQKLGVSPKKSWVVEDSQHGVDAGRSAGAKCIGILTTHENLKGTDIKVKTFEELTQIFKKLWKISFKD